MSLTKALAGQPGPLPPGLLEYLIQEACQSETSSGEASVLISRQQLTPAQADRLGDAHPDASPMLRARVLLASLDTTRLLRHLSAPEHDPQVAEHVAKFTTDPDLLAQLVDFPAPAVAAAAAANPACPPHSLRCFFRRLGAGPDEVPPPPDAQAAEYTQAVLATHGPAGVTALLSATRAPHLLQQAAGVPGLSREQAIVLVTEWIVPQVTGAQAASNPTATVYAPATRALLPLLDQPTLRALWQAWLPHHRVYRHAARTARTILVALAAAGGDIGDTPVSLFFDQVRLAETQAAALLTEAAAPVCGDNAAAWRTLFTLADGFPGTLAELLATVEAVCVAPSPTTDLAGR